MHNSKLVIILKSLQTKEFHQFEKYVYERYPNLDHFNIQFFNLLATAYPSMESKAIIKENMMQKLQLDGEDGDKKIRYAATDITQHLENFLVWKLVEDNPDLKNQLLIDAYSTRLLFKQYDQLMLEIEKSHAKKNNFDLEYFSQLFLYEQKKYSNMREMDLRSDKNNLQSLTETLDINYIIHKLYYICEMLNNNYTYSFQFQTYLLSETLKIIDQDPFDKIKIIQIYKSVLHTLLEPDKNNHFYELKDKLEEHRQDLPLDKLYELYKYLLNFAVRKINKGDDTFYQELFALYQKQDTEKILIQNGFISEFSFKNIIVIALRLNEIEWAEYFLDKYENFLQPDIKENSIRYNTAYIHFQKKEFHNTLELLSQVEFTDICYHLDSKSLLLKTFFELDETDPFLSLVEAFKVYIKRNKKITEKQALHYNNFINYCNKLYKCKHNHYKNLESLEDEIATVNAMDKKWLVNKCKTFQERV